MCSTKWSRTIYDRPVQRITHMAQFEVRVVIDQDTSEMMSVRFDASPSQLIKDMLDVIRNIFGCDVYLYHNWMRLSPDKTFAYYGMPESLVDERVYAERVPSSHALTRVLDPTMERAVSFMAADVTHWPPQHNVAHMPDALGSTSMQVLVDTLCEHRGWRPADKDFYRMQDGQLKKVVFDANDTVDSLVLGFEIIYVECSLNEN